MTVMTVTTVNRARAEYHDGHPVEGDETRNGHCMHYQMEADRRQAVQAELLLRKTG